MSETKQVSALYEQYETDLAAENDGAWVEFRGGVHVRVRSENSKKAVDFAHKLAKKQRQVIVANGGVLPKELADANEVALCEQALVADWKGVTDKAGNPLACTPENVRRVMKELPAFRRDVLFAARVDETFKVEQDAAVEAMGETSPPASERT